MNIPDEKIYLAITSVPIAFEKSVLTLDSSHRHYQADLYGCFRQSTCQLDGIFQIVDDLYCRELIHKARLSLADLLDFYRKPDGVGRSSAQPSGDVGQGGNFDAFISKININGC